MPLEQTTDKLKEKIPQIDGDRAKETAFGLLDSLKPMLSFIWGFTLNLAGVVWKIFMDALGRKYD